MRRCPWRRGAIGSRIAERFGAESVARQRGVTRLRIHFEMLLDVFTAVRRRRPGVGADDVDTAARHADFDVRSELPVLLDDRVRGRRQHAAGKATVKVDRE
jgi:hypothetical protein